MQTCKLIQFVFAPRYQTPIEISRKYLNCLFVALPAPSAILHGMETAQLLNCDVNPYFSSFGKFALTSYILTTNSIDLCQILSSL